MILRPTGDQEPHTRLMLTAACMFLVFYKWIPLAFYLIDDFFLFFALMWICKSPEVMGNEKYMAVHAVLILMNLCINIFSLGHFALKHDKQVLIVSIQCAIEFLTTCTMSYIMN